MTGTAAPTLTAGPGDDLVATSCDLVPLLRAEAGESERRGRLTDRSTAALREHGLLSLFAPRRYGGHECDLRTATAVLTELGRGCGSSAWVAALMSGASYLVSLLGEQACQDVWGTDPRAGVCGGFGMPDAATRTSEGLMVSGRWRPLSGVHQAQWAMLGVPLLDALGATAGHGMALVPIPEPTVEQTWHVAGMQGTGSHTLVVDGAVVPDDRVLPFPRVLSEAGPGEYPQGSIYSAAPFPFLSVAMLGPLLGMADAAAGLARDHLAGKSGGATIYARAIDSPGVRFRVADAAHLIDTAHLLADRAIGDVEQGVRTGRRLSRELRARIRMDVGSVARGTTEAVRLLLDACGAGGFDLGRPIQQIWRNLEVASRHPMLTFDLGREVYGRALLGVEEQVTPLF